MAGVAAEAWCCAPKGCVDIGSRYSGCVVRSEVLILALKKARSGADGWLFAVAGAVRRTGSSQRLRVGCAGSLLVGCEIEHDISLPRKERKKIGSLHSEKKLEKEEKGGAMFK